MVLKFFYGNDTEEGSIDRLVKTFNLDITQVYPPLKDVPTTDLQVRFHKITHIN